MEALEATYIGLGRGSSEWSLLTRCGLALLLVVIGEIAGASGARLVQYAILGAVCGPVAHSSVYTAHWKESCGP